MPHTDKELFSSMDELHIHFLEGRIGELEKELRDTQNAFVRMVSRITGTQPKPCEFGDPECVGDLSEEAVRIVERVLAGEIKLYEVDEVNALKMTVEEGKEIIGSLRASLGDLQGPAATPVPYLRSPAAAETFEEKFCRELDNSPRPFPRACPSCLEVTPPWIAPQLHLRDCPAAPAAPVPCRGSGARLLYGVRFRCGYCDAEGAVELGPDGSKRVPQHFSLQPPAANVPGVVQPRSEGEAGVGTTPSPEAPGEAVTAMLNEMCDRWATAWLSPGGPSHDDMLPQLAGEAYKMGILEGVKLAAEKAAENSELVIDIRETTSPKDWRPGIASAIARLKGGCSAQEFIDLIWYDGWFSGKGRA